MLVLYFAYWLCNILWCQLTAKIVLNETEEYLVVYNTGFKQKRKYMMKYIKRTQDEVHKSNSDSVIFENIYGKSSVSAL